MATMLIRRTAAHETSMTRYMNAGSVAFTRQVTALASRFRAGNGKGVTDGPFGGASIGAIHQAQAFIYNQMHRQAAMLAYIDIIRYLTLFCALMIPVLFFIPRPPKGMHAGH
jgi:DHA2 family multidrug resistance protein